MARRSRTVSARTLTLSVRSACTRSTRAAYMSEYRSAMSKLIWLSATKSSSSVREDTFRAMASPCSRKAFRRTTPLTSILEYAAERTRSRLLKFSSGISTWYFLQVRMSSPPRSANCRFRMMPSSWFMPRKDMSAMVTWCPKQLSAILEVSSALLTTMGRSANMRWMPLSTLLRRSALRQEMACLACAQPRMARGAELWLMPTSEEATYPSRNSAGKSQKSKSARSSGGSVRKRCTESQTLLKLNCSTSTISITCGNSRSTSEKVIAERSRSSRSASASMTSTPFSTTSSGRMSRPAPKLMRTSFMRSRTSATPISRFPKKPSRLRRRRSSTNASTIAGFSEATSAFSTVTANPVSK
ncbi:PP36 [Orf virus]|uniref:PP36 n=1 Tax=Orf virus TaxID=10258 RepID=F1AXD2_ORFV|nr:PP36 [Orf virus]